jgi:hypothetical protein
MATFIPASIKRKLANPGERAKISDADLEKYAPDLAKKRAYNKKRAGENATLYNPNALLSGEDLRTAVKGEVDSELNPQVGAANREALNLESQRDQLAKIVGDIYGQLQPAATAAAATAGAAGTRLSEGLATSGADFLKDIDARAAASKASSDQDAAIRGTGLDAGTSTRLAQEFLLQKTRAEAQTQGAQSLATAQSGGAIARAGMAAQVLPAQASADVKDLANKFAPSIMEARDKAGELEASRGPLTTKILNAMRQSEFEKSATAQTLNLKADQAKVDAAVAQDKSDVAHQNADTSQTQAEISKARLEETNRHNTAMEGANTSAERLAETKRHNRVMEGLKNKKGGQTTPLRTPNEVGTALKPAKGALSQIKTGKITDPKTGKVVYDLKGMNRQHVAAILAREGVDDALVSAILDAVPKYNKGGKPHLSKETQHKLRMAGFSAKQIAQALGIPTAGTYAKQVSAKPAINLPKVPGGGLH